MRWGFATRRRRSPRFCRTSIQWRPAPWNKAIKTRTNAPMPSAASGLYSSGMLARSVGMLAPQFPVLFHTLLHTDSHEGCDLFGGS